MFRLALEILVERLILLLVTGPGTDRLFLGGECVR